jgi:hypothetical protein
MQASACSADRGSRIPVIDSKVSVAETRCSIRVNLGPGQDHRPVDGARRSHAAENFHAQPRRFHSRPAPRAVQIGGCYQLGGCASIGRSVRMSVMGPNSEKLRVSISSPRCLQERTSGQESGIASRDFVHHDDRALLTDRASTPGGPARAISNGCPGTGQTAAVAGVSGAGPVVPSERTLTALNGTFRDVSALSRTATPGQAIALAPVAGGPLAPARP